MPLPLAEKQTGEQGVLWHASRSRLRAVPSPELSVDFLPDRRFNERGVLTSVHLTPVFDFAGIDRVGEKPA